MFCLCPSKCGQKQCLSFCMGMRGLDSAKKSVLVLSFTGLLSHGPTLLTRMPYLVIPAYLYALMGRSAKHNLTYRAIQKHLVHQMKEAMEPGCPSDYFLAYVGGKGDRKHRAQWLELERHYECPLVQHVSCWTIYAVLSFPFVAKFNRAIHQDVNSFPARR